MVPKNLQLGSKFGSPRKLFPWAKKVSTGYTNQYEITTKQYQLLTTIVLHCLYKAIQKRFFENLCGVGFLGSKQHTRRHVVPL